MMIVLSWTREKGRLQMNSGKYYAGVSITVLRLSAPVVSIMSVVSIKPVVSITHLSGNCILIIIFYLIVVMSHP